MTGSDGVDIPVRAERRGKALGAASTSLKRRKDEHTQDETEWRRFGKKIRELNNGEDVDIGFNPQFIAEALRVVPESEVILELKSTNKPGLLKAGNDFLYVVMPVNLQ